MPVGVRNAAKPIVRDDLAQLSLPRGEGQDANLRRFSMVCISPKALSKSGPEVKSP